jgi:hypothetical protein
MASIDHESTCAEAFAGVTKQAKADVIAGIDRKVGAKGAARPNGGRFRRRVAPRLRASPPARGVVPTLSLASMVRSRRACADSRAMRIGEHLASHLRDS